MEMLINIYDDEQSELILDETNFNPNAVQNFHNLGEKENWTESNTNLQRYQNSSFLQMHVFDDSDNFIITLNSGKPLLRQPSTGKFYFGDYHSHQGTYMVGKKHRAVPHETLELIRDNQINLYPYNQIPGDSTNAQKYSLKLSEIFEVLKNIPNHNVLKDTKYKIKYAVFGDMLLEFASRLVINATSGDTELSAEEQEGGAN
jgi:hypothetical protein